MDAFESQLHPHLAQPVSMAGFPAGTFADGPLFADGLLFADGSSFAYGPSSLPSEQDSTEDPPPVSPPDSETTAQQRVAIHRELMEEYAPVGMDEDWLVSQLADLRIYLEEYKALREAAIRTATAMFGELCGVLQQPSLIEGSPHAASATLPPDEVIVAARLSKPVTQAEQKIARTREQICEYKNRFMKLQEQRHLRELPRLVASAGLTIDLVSQPVCTPAATPHTPEVEPRDPAAPKETRGWLATAETEADCEEIFREWLRHAKLPCPYCGSMEPTLELTTRRVLQCRCCGRQRGLRTGTFLAHANISFLAMVKAVRLLAQHPDVTIETLCRVTSLSAKTMHGLRSQILQAFQAPASRTSLLAACGWQPE